MAYSEDRKPRDGWPFLRHLARNVMENASLDGTATFDEADVKAATALMNRDQLAQYWDQAMQISGEWAELMESVAEKSGVEHVIFDPDLKIFVRLLEGSR